jgi:hypothetical protein
MFQRNISPPSSESKSMPWRALIAAFLLGLFCDCEGGGWELVWQQSGLDLNDCRGWQVSRWVSLSNRVAKLQQSQHSQNRNFQWHIILSRILVTETGFGLVIGFINRFTVRNYKQLLITLPVIQFTIIFYWLQLIQRCRCFNTLWLTVAHTHTH